MKHNLSNPTKFKHIQSNPTKLKHIQSNPIKGVGRGDRRVRYGAAPEERDQGELARAAVGGRRRGRVARGDQHAALLRAGGRVQR